MILQQMVKFLDNVMGLGIKIGRLIVRRRRRIVLHGLHG